LGLSLRPQMKMGKALYFHENEKGVRKKGREVDRRYLTLLPGWKGPREERELPPGAMTKRLGFIWDQEKENNEIGEV